MNNDLSRKDKISLGKDDMLKIFKKQKILG
jgi:hypothetical protein